MQETFASYVKDYYIGKFGASVASYDQQYLKNTTPAESCKYQPDIQFQYFTKYHDLRVRMKLCAWLLLMLSEHCFYFIDHAFDY